MRAVLSVAAVLTFVVLAACGAARAPREQAHASVLLVAEAVRQADQACATIALARRDRELAEACDAGYRLARDGLLAAEAGVDVWGSAGAGDVPCAAAHALAGLDALVSSLEHAGGSVPPVVGDARKLAVPLVAACTVVASSRGR